MKIGDFVRVLRGTEEGHIVRFLPNDYVEIETSDGFTIPVSAHELVPVSSEESLRFGETTPETKTNVDRSSTDQVQKPPAHHETLLMVVPQEDGILGFWLTNATDCTMLYSLYLHESQRDPGISTGTLRPGTLENTGQCAVRDLRPDTVCIVQSIFHPTKSGGCPEPVVHKIRLSHVLKHGKKTPLDAINQKGYRFDLLEQAGDIDPDALRNSLLGAGDIPRRGVNVPNTTASDLIVDLHIESLTDHPELLTSSEIFDLQLRTFEQELDKAIAGNAKSIKFIHGVGNGTLRYNIHKRLSQLKDILYYKDADKEKFGFGATTIELK
jgi:hypothetical protein